MSFLLYLIVQLWTGVYFLLYRVYLETVYVILMRGGQTLMESHLKFGCNDCGDCDCDCDSKCTTSNTAFVFFVTTVVTAERVLQLYLALYNPPPPYPPARQATATRTKSH